MAKQHVKKARFRAFCRKQAAAGLINDERGQWIRANTVSGEAKNMHRDLMAGYRIGQHKRKARVKVMAPEGEEQ